MTDRTYDPRLEHVGRCIDDVDGELERAVCESLYKGSAQRRRRSWIVLLLGIKHTLRGLLFSWPLYLLGLVAWVLPSGKSAWLSLLLLPGIALSAVILWRGIVDDYQRFVHRVLLNPGAARHILWRTS